MDKAIGKSTTMTYTYLALGDSYTIGEQVLQANNFPYQTVQLLRSSGLAITAPEIIATTGHTTDELQSDIKNTTTLPQYDFVSVLIGVNNQYRGRTIENFTLEFTQILQKAIEFAGGNPNHVFVLSIPDWGVTPYALEKDVNKIATEIDAFNGVCKNVAEQNATHFIDITTSQRLDGNKEAYLAPDLLHPSSLEYSKWAIALSNKILEVISK
jgi:lysophospholipase L1-like esterase